MKDLLKDINRLRKERKAVILAHTYQPAEIQELADYVGDSYGLSVKASQLEDADVIVFCGVSFMAETAAILNPQKTVLMPEPSAGCPMADTITADQLRAFKAKHPGAPVVCYVNSTAEVKAESDICCTSSNALKVVKSLGDVPEILFVPDQYLGHFVEQQLGRKLVCWNGGCPVHYQLTADIIRGMKAKYPGYKVMVHPETTPEAQAEADHIL
ncbi:MAG: quinolinate synthase NadA, partial [Victivallales bacterium]|nr:quinolinate synthase NadA [Victivallales bacterium]